jgi:hypothetical protein
MVRVRLEAIGAKIGAKPVGHEPELAATLVKSNVDVNDVHRGRREAKQVPEASATETGDHGHDREVETVQHDQWFLRA